VGFDPHTVSSGEQLALQCILPMGLDLS
jgi:hypothetical protein